MQNPFVTTYSKIPDSSYIPTEQISEIVENFSYPNPTESVYKITGVRGSGKTVLLAKLEEEIKKLDDKWIIVRISPARDMLQQLLALLSDDLSKNKDTSEKDDKYFDVGAEIEKLLKIAEETHKKVLIGIDEISKNKEVVAFVSEYGKWLRADYPIYLICTGLYENIEQLSNVPNLTFFRRATTVMTGELSFIKMSELYRKFLKIDSLDAQGLARLTKGYAYAFQELGVICFKNGLVSVDEVTDDLKTELYAYAYEKIWEELSEGDRTLARLIVDQEEYKKEEVVSRMEKPQNYPVYRDRLLRRGVIKKRQGYIGFALPFFGEYIKEYNK